MNAALASIRDFEKNTESLLTPYFWMILYMWSFKWLTYTKYSKIAASKIITSYVILLKIWINRKLFLKLSSSKLNYK